MSPVGWIANQRRATTCPEELTDLCQHKGIDLIRSLLLAEVLLIDGEMSEKENNFAQAVGSQLKALCLVANVFKALDAVERGRYRAQMDPVAEKLWTISQDPYLRSKIELYKTATRK